jgi:hypothetical protein
MKVGNSTSDAGSLEFSVSGGVTCLDIKPDEIYVYKSFRRRDVSTISGPARGVCIW